MAAETFQFEADFIASLRCIPMVVRMKLDTCGIKLKLDQWHQFSTAERQQLVTQPCGTPDQVQVYRQDLQALILERTQQQASELAIAPHPPWLETRTIPSALLEKAQAQGLTLTLEQWQALLPLQRFALIKLSRPSHESNNFVPALQEFGLLPQTEVNAKVQS